MARPREAGGGSDRYPVHQGGALLLPESPEAVACHPGPGAEILVECVGHALSSRLPMVLF